MKQNLEQFVAQHREEFDDQALPQGTWEKIQNSIAAENPKTLAPVAANGEKYQGRWALLRPRTLAWSAAAAVLVVVAWMGLFPTATEQELLPPPLVQSQPENKLSPSSDQAVAATSPSPKAAAWVPENKNTVNTGRQNVLPAAITSPAFYAQKAQVCNAIVDMESAATRYAAANAIEKMSCVDPEILQVLVKTMNHDPNTNVRLAAVETLGKFYREPYVKKALVRSLQEQKDPVVQVALIDLLGKMRSQALVKALEKLVQDQNTPQPVKDQAYSNLLRYQ